MNQALHLFGVRLVGATPENSRKLLLTLAFVSIAFAARRSMPAIASSWAAPAAM